MIHCKARMIASQRRDGNARLRGGERHCERRSLLGSPREVLRFAFLTRTWHWDFQAEYDRHIR